MIVRTRYSGDVAVRSTWPDRTFPPSRSMGFTPAGVPVTTESAVGLPALGRGIRLVAGLAASLDLSVYEGENADKRLREDAYPADLFDRPYEGMSCFDWLYDIFAGLEATENMVLIKLKSKGKVTELQPIPMDFVRITIDQKTREKRFDIVGQTGQITTLTTADVLHIRGHTPYGGPIGVSRIWQHRDPAGSMLAAYRFESAFFRNHARPDLAIIFPQGVTKEQANQWREEWTAQYGGPDNSGKPIPLGGGAQIQPIPVSMEDAQFLEGKKYGLEEIGRIMDIDVEMLGATVPRPNKAESLDFFLRVQMGPRLRRVEHAFLADTDLFPAGTPLYPQFQVHDLMFLDAVRRAQVQHEQIQDGTLLVDEARAENGRPPLPPIPDDYTQTPGMIPQITPVGGAPNEKVISDTQATQNEVQDLQGRGITIPSLELRVEQDMEPLAREMGLAFGNMADALGKFSTMATELQQKAADLESDRDVRAQMREKREIERVAAQARRDEAQADAFRTVSQPQITVNVEPTPVTIENTVNVQPAEVQMTLLDDDQPTNLTVDFIRNANGTIKQATVTED